MNLALRVPSLPFIAVTALAAKQGDAPALVDMPEPAAEHSLVSVRYKGRDTHGDSHQLTVDNSPDGTGEYWSQVAGSFDDAVRAARDLAVVDGYDDVPPGHFARTSVAVLDAGSGVWQLKRMSFLDGMGDGMDAIISMPIDAQVAASTSDVSVPFGGDPAVGFDRPDSIAVRFDDPRVKALVGVDTIALAPGR